MILSSVVLDESPRGNHVRLLEPRPRSDRNGGVVRSSSIHEAPYYSGVHAWNSSLTKEKGPSVPSADLATAQGRIAALGICRKGKGEAHVWKNRKHKQLDREPVSSSPPRPKQLSGEVTAGRALRGRPLAACVLPRRRTHVGMVS